MGTGIVSVALHADGQETLSRALLVLTAGAWVLLGALFLNRLCFDNTRWWHEAQRPSALTAVAGTAVLGARLAILGWSWAGWTLLAAATLFCLLLTSVAGPWPIVPEHRGRLPGGRRTAVAGGPRG